MKSVCALTSSLPHRRDPGSEKLLRAFISSLKSLLSIACFSVCVIFFQSSSAGQQSRSMASESQNLSAVTEGRNSASPGTDTCLFFCHDGFFSIDYF